MRKPRQQGGFWFANAVRTSDLSSTCRLIALVLVGIADNDSGQVRVSLTTLATFTGLGRSTVARGLNQLEAEGWLKRSRPASWESMQKRETTAYTTLIPPGFPVSSSPVAGLPPKSSSPVPGRVLVPETQTTSATAGHSSIGTTRAVARSAGATREPRVVVGADIDELDFTPWDVWVRPNDYDDVEHAEVAIEPALSRGRIGTFPLPAFEAGYDTFRAIASDIFENVEASVEQIISTHRCGGSPFGCGVSREYLTDEEPFLNVTVPRPLLDAWTTRLADITRATVARHTEAAAA